MRIRRGDSARDGRADRCGTSFPVLRRWTHDRSGNHEIGAFGLSFQPRTRESKSAQRAYCNDHSHSSSSGMRLRASGQRGPPADDRGEPLCLTSSEGHRYQNSMRYPLVRDAVSVAADTVSFFLFRTIESLKRTLAAMKRVTASHPSRTEVLRHRDSLPEWTETRIRVSVEPPKAAE